MKSMIDDKKIDDAVVAMKQGTLNYAELMRANEFDPETMFLIYWRVNFEERVDFKIEPESTLKNEIRAAFFAGLVSSMQALGDYISRSRVSPASQDSIDHFRRRLVEGVSRVLTTQEQASGKL